MTEAKRVNVRGRPSANVPNPVDVYARQRMRLRRTMLNMSQQTLARKLGITFQQVQKYEKGGNRIGFSRMCDIADILGITLDYFREGMDRNIAKSSPMRLANPDGEEIKQEYADDPLKSSEAMALMSNYFKIRNRKIAKQIFNLIRDISVSNSVIPD